jgi:hypothetical protein
LERCRREIAAIEDQLRVGHPDVHGLCLAPADWSEELRIIEAERRKAAGVESGGGEERSFVEVDRRIAGDQRAPRKFVETGLRR